MSNENGKVVWLGERRPQSEPDELWQEVAGLGADLVELTIIYERIKAERETTERALALMTEALDRLAAERKRHWSTRLEKWWRSLWNR